jgi:hypothetical protein
VKKPTPLPTIDLDFLQGIAMRKLYLRQRRLDACEDVGHNPEFPVEGILYKDSEIWQTAHRELTKVIADREEEKGTLRRTGKATKRNMRR